MLVRKNSLTAGGRRIGMGESGGREEDYIWPDIEGADESRQ